MLMLFTEIVQFISLNLYSLLQHNDCLMLSINSLELKKGAIKRIESMNQLRNATMRPNAQ